MQMFVIHWTEWDTESMLPKRSFDATGKLYPTERSATEMATKLAEKLNLVEAGAEYTFTIKPVQPRIVESTR